MTTGASTTPPIWLIAPFAIEGLFTLFLLYVGISFSGSQLRSSDVLIYSAPLIFVLATGGLAWWLWASELRSIAILMTVLAPILLFSALFVVLGVGI